MIETNQVTEADLPPGYSLNKPSSAQTVIGKITRVGGVIVRFPLANRFMSEASRDLEPVREKFGSTHTSTCPHSRQVIMRRAGENGEEMLTIYRV